MGTVRYTTVNGEVIAEKRGGVRRQYVPDPLGSTVALLDNAQAKTDTFQYWPYGEEAVRTGTTDTPLRFVGTLGYYRDSTTRSYVRARHLDNRAGRWTTEDPIGFMGRDANLLRYARSRPVTKVDPSGTHDIPFFGRCHDEDVNPVETWPPLVQLFGHIVVDHPCNDVVSAALQWGYGYYCGLCRAGGLREPSTPRRPGGLKIPYDSLDAACKAHDECLEGKYDFFNPVRQFNCNVSLCTAASRCAKGLCRNCDARCQAAAKHVRALYCVVPDLPPGGGEGGDMLIV
jgi:RHS repeat-associated protein